MSELKKWMVEVEVDVKPDEKPEENDSNFVGVDETNIDRIKMDLPNLDWTSADDEYLPEDRDDANSDNAQYASSDFGSHASAGTGSCSVPDPREFDDALRAIHEIPFQNIPPTMPCEFALYTGCPKVFCPFTRWEQWIHHEIEVHLDYKLPATCLCWFCDDFKFDAAIQTDGDRWLNFGNRMQHIAEHFREGERGHIRPDFYFIEHLWSNGMITQEVFDREKNIREPLRSLICQGLASSRPKADRL